MVESMIERFACIIDGVWLVGMCCNSGNSRLRVDNVDGGDR